MTYYEIVAWIMPNLIFTMKLTDWNSVLDI